MARKNTENDITVRNAEFRYLNFAGRPTTYKPEGGVRSFQLILPPDVAREMDEFGWNVKMTRPRATATDEEIEKFESRPYVEVTVSYKIDELAPKIALITDVQTLLSEETAFLVDEADIVKMDVVINPSFWNVSGKTGVKAYLRKAFITIVQDDLDQEYSHIPVVGTTQVAL